MTQLDGLPWLCLRSSSKGSAPLTPWTLPSQPHHPCQLWHSWQSTLYQSLPLLKTLKFEPVPRLSTARSSRRVWEVLATLVIAGPSKACYSFLNRIVIQVLCRKLRRKHFKKTQKPPIFLQLNYKHIGFIHSCFHFLLWIMLLWSLDYKYLYQNTVCFKKIQYVFISPG